MSFNSEEQVKIEETDEQGKIEEIDEKGKIEETDEQGKIEEVKIEQQPKIEVQSLKLETENKSQEKPRSFIDNFISPREKDKDVIPKETQEKTDETNKSFLDNFVSPRDKPKPPKSNKPNWMSNIKKKKHLQN